MNRFLLTAILILVCAPALANEAIPPALIRQPTQPLEADLVISARQLMDRMKAKASFLIVDVRDKADFDALHISGAVHSPLHFLKNRPYLRSAPIIVVDQGLSYHRLAPVCRALKSAGADVRLLYGGMNAWCGLNGPVVGDAARQMDYVRIMPADFFQEKNMAGVTVCDVSAVRSDLSGQLLPDAVHLPVGTEPDKLKAFRKSRSSDAMLILVSDAEPDAANAVHAFRQAGFSAVFVLSGGLREYKNYLEGLTLSWQPKGARMVQVNPCQGCGTQTSDN